MIEATIVEAGPPVVRDIHAKAYQHLCPFGDDGGVLDGSVRHCKQRDERRVWRL